MNLRLYNCLVNKMQEEGGQWRVSLLELVVWLGEQGGTVDEFVYFMDANMLTDKSPADKDTYTLSR